LGGGAVSVEIRTIRAPPQNGKCPACKIFLLLWGPEVTAGTHAVRGGFFDRIAPLRPIVEGQSSRLPTSGAYPDHETWRLEMRQESDQQMTRITRIRIFAGHSLFVPLPVRILFSRRGFRRYATQVRKTQRIMSHAETQGRRVWNTCRSRVSLRLCVCEFGCGGAFGGFLDSCFRRNDMRGCISQRRRDRKGRRR